MKTAVIHRYQVAPVGVSTVEMPKGARIVNVQPGKTGWNIYASHITPPADAVPAMEKRHFVGLKTGVEFPAGAEYLATIRGGIHLLSLPTNGHLNDWLTLYPAIDETLAES